MFLVSDFEVFRREHVKMHRFPVVFSLPVQKFGFYYYMLSSHGAADQLGTDSCEAQYVVKPKNRQQHLLNQAPFERVLTVANDSLSIVTAALKAQIR